MKNEFYISDLRTDFNTIAFIRSRKDIVSMIASLHCRSVMILWNIGILLHEKDVVYLEPGALGLPIRECYFSDNSHYAGIKEKYSEHIEAMFSLAGLPVGDGSFVSDIVNIETILARVTIPVAREEEKVSVKKTRNELSLMTPAINWDIYFPGIGVEDGYDYIVEEPAFFTEVNSLVEGLSLEEWQAYLRWYMIHAFAPYLKGGFAEENFLFYGKILSGVE
jgi:predicted metalloendopeptidase